MLNPLLIKRKGLIVETSKIESGGFWIDAETGEVLGVVGAEERFTPDTLDKAEWVLEKMQKADAEKTALLLRRDAITANIDAEIRKMQNKRDYLDARFGPDLSEFAKRSLEGGKSKTLTTPYGKMSFRLVPSRLSVIDEQKALEWADAHCPQAVKITKKLLPSALDGEKVAAELPALFEMTEPRESFKIDTGIKA